MTTIVGKSKSYMTKNKEKVYIGVLILIPIILFIMRLQGGYVAGSMTDWINQHIVFPDYFRKLFYETKNLFPDYSVELGGGQNIYNFAYYGLYNPLYMLSYMFPFVKMSTYMQAIGLIEEIFGGILLYIWLKNHMSKDYSFLGACLYSFSLSVVCHSFMQLMFVNYLPFLILMFIGYDRYQKNQKTLMITLSTLAMLLCSFYFAVGGIVAFFLYAITDTEKWDKSSKFSIKKLINYLWFKFYPAVFGCFLSLFYLVPVYFAMSSGRKSEAHISKIKLLIPNLEFSKIYGAYGIGLGAISFIVICIGLFYKNGRERVFACSMFIILILPLCDYMLNGGLYLRNKCVIPFVPIVCYLVADFTRQFHEKRIDKRKLKIGFVMAAVLLILSTRGLNRQKLITLLVGLLVYAIVLFYCYEKRQLALVIVMMTATIIFSVKYIYEIKYDTVTDKFLNQIENPSIDQAIEEILDEDQTLYRMNVQEDFLFSKTDMNKIYKIGQNIDSCYSSVNSAQYKEFRNDTIKLAISNRNTLMQNMSTNPIYLRFMGIKYFVGTVELPEYTKIKSIDNIKVYKNDNVLPLAYATTNTISEEQYKELSIHEKQLALLKYGVVGDNQGSLSFDTQSINPQVKPIYSENLVITKSLNGVNVKAKKDVEYTMNLNRTSSQDEYLFVSLDLKNNTNYQDIKIILNGEINLLSAPKSYYYNKNETFCFTSIIKKGTSDVKIVFGEGDYEISNITSYISPYEANLLENLKLSDVDLKVNKNKSGYVGKIEANEDEWVLTTIPYDENFKIYIDGKETKLEKVNTAFIGFHVGKGSHDVKITYTPPGKLLGMISSIVVAVIYIIYVNYLKYCRNKKVLKCK